MKLTCFFAAILTLSFSSAAISFADENHEIIEKVMKEGLKGDDSPLAKILEESATEEEVTSLASLIKTMEGTEAPVGDQDAYDDKVAELIAAIDAIAGGDMSGPAIDRLDSASNCKGCHSDHKPKKD
ncbi:MAG: hypothetical protein P1U68_01840 [Verrucomicrobiales bacterium]|nr:hypothetical protein [Verrucomicrobiales bacterium]